MKVRLAVPVEVDMSYASSVEPIEFGYVMDFPRSEEISQHHGDGLEAHCVSSRPVGRFGEG